VFCRKRSPHEPTHASGLETRLRAIVRDKATLRAVLEAIRPGLESSGEYGETD
jgi:hypothetical protein